MVRHELIRIRLPAPQTLLSRIRPSCSGDSHSSTRSREPPGREIAVDRGQPASRSGASLGSRPTTRELVSTATAFSGAFSRVRRCAGCPLPASGARRQSTRCTAPPVARSRRRPRRFRRHNHLPHPSRHAHRPANCARPSLGGTKWSRRWRNSCATTTRCTSRRHVSAIRKNAGVAGATIHQRAPSCTRRSTAVQARARAPTSSRASLLICWRPALELTTTNLHRTLLHPLLSLSRPPSPAFSPPASPTPPLSVSADRSASSLPAHFPPRTPSDPAPTVESQGFVLYLSSLVAWVAFLVWGLCPDDWLEAAGIEWYPARSDSLLRDR